MSIAKSTIDLDRGTRRFQRNALRGGQKPEATPPVNPRGIFDPALLRSAIPQAFRKLDPREMIRNPVIFVVEITSVLVTLLIVLNVTGVATVEGPAGLGFQVQIALWLWFTVLFATYAEAVAEARGRAQAASLRRTRSESVAHRRLADGSLENVGSSELRKGDIIVVDEGETIPGDGDVIEGVAYVNEAAITGESAPVLKEPGTDIRSSVTGGTQVTSDSLVIRITADPGETFLDRMIALVEGAKRQRTPNEIALSILLSGLSLVFLLATVTLRPFGLYAGETVDTVALIALLVCLIPTTIGGLLSAIGIAGMDRVARFNVLAMSGRAVEAAGDVDVLLLDKTGTITYGNRMASALIPAAGVRIEDLAEAAMLSSLADETPEGRSIVTLVKDKYGVPPRDAAALGDATFIKFTAQTRMSGLDLGTRQIRKGAVDAVATHARGMPDDVREAAGKIGDTGGTPLAVSDGTRVLGIIHLKDIVKQGIRERFVRFRAMGIRTVMITGDNPRTAKAIAGEAGVDDFLAEATPETKMRLIKDDEEIACLRRSVPFVRRAKEHVVIRAIAALLAAADILD
jgi:K+-transporting ATPase ATPase B chain